jgi:hypothetical protein
LEFPDNFHKKPFGAGRKTGLAFSGCIRMSNCRKGLKGLERLLNSRSKEKTEYGKIFSIKRK